LVLPPRASRTLESEITIKRTNKTPTERIKAGAKLLILAIIAMFKNLQILLTRR
jgi:hypothetical protein